MTASMEPSHTRTDSHVEEISMTQDCEHWLVQRRVNEPYWACVDCEAEFRPVQTGTPTPNEIVRRALGRLGLEER